MKLIYKKVGQRLLEVIIASISFVMIVFVLGTSEQNKTKNTLDTPSNIQFQFHNSASEWEIFIEENDLDEILTGKDKEIIIKMLDNEFNNTGLLEDEENIDLFDTKETILVPVNKKSCSPLRSGGAVLKHGERVLAYKQREDVPSICNVERRVCDNGKLLGSYTQRFCREDVNYEYQKKDVILYNDLPTNPYIQPSKLAPDRNADFSVNGKRNEYIAPVTTWNNADKSNSMYSNNNIGLNKISKNNCKTPWGETVKHGQFTKAYRSKYGFKDRACEVELRYCDDGVLKGSFRYKTCEYIDLLYEDYKYGIKEGDDEITAKHILDTLRQ